MKNHGKDAGKKLEYKNLFALIFKIISADNDKLVAYVCRFTAHFHNARQLLRRFLREVISANTSALLQSSQCGAHQAKHQQQG